MIRLILILIIIAIAAAAACTGSSRDALPDALPMCADLGCPGPDLACSGLGSGRRCFCHNTACEPPAPSSPRNGAP